MSTIVSLGPYRILLDLHSCLTLHKYCLELISGVFYFLFFFFSGFPLVLNERYSLFSSTLNTTVCFSSIFCPLVCEIFMHCTLKQQCYLQILWAAFMLLGKYSLHDTSISPALCHSQFTAVACYCALCSTVLSWKRYCSPCPYLSTIFVL